MTNRELVDAAWAEALKSTISGVEWQNRVTNGYKGKPYNWQATAFGRSKALLDQVVDVPAPPGFGAKIPQPPARPTTTPMVVKNETEFLNAAARGGVVAIFGEVMLTRETQIVTGNLAIVPANGYRLDRLLCSASGSLKVNASRVWIHDLVLGGGLLDGVKIGDGVHAQSVDIAGNWIRDVGWQAVLVGSSGCDDLFVRRNLMERLGKSNPTDARVGHGIYLGGATSRVVVQQNLIRPAAFGAQCYPGPSDVLFTQNTVEGGVTRGGFQVSDVSRNVRFVGNVIKGAPSAAFEVWANVGWADDNIAWECADGMWEPGYSQFSGSNNVVGDPARIAKGFIRPASFDYVLSADAGAP